MPTSATSDFSTTPTSEPANAKTIIGEHVDIRGNIWSKEDLVIEGSLIGKIKVENNHIIVGSKGRVQAQINAKNVTIYGQLTGDINASGTVKITKDASFGGEIIAKSISVEDGAYLKGTFEIQREPKKTDPAMGKATSKPIQGTVGSSANQPAEKSHLGSKTQ